MNGDEEATGNYSGGNYTIVCNEPTQGNQDGGKTAMENCLSKNPDINVVYSDQRALRRRAPHRRCRRRATPAR